MSLLQMSLALSSLARLSLPRPVFDLASGTTTTMASSNFKITQDETSRPIFPRRDNRFESADDGNYRDLTDTDSGRKLGLPVPILYEK